MPARRLEVADVLRSFEASYLATQGPHLSPQQKRVLRALSRCRTAALGGHKLLCDDGCGYDEISYNSCHNRHCPKCQGAKRAEWLEREAAHLLDVPYFHVVFTLPEELGPLVLQNKRLLYGALFRAASETLLAIARDPKHLGAEIGFLAVLHTWGQNLLDHPHLHCVVPGGGISPDGSRWIPCRSGFFLPVRVLSRLFRGKFLALLGDIHAQGKLTLAGRMAPLREPSAWRGFLRRLRAMEWVVYSKPPFGGARQVLKYLARYTHRVAISNARLLSMTGGKVRFRWKDYARGGKARVMELEAHEFIRRFLLHVLPSGFVRIRHFGFLANRSRSKKLDLARRLLGQPVPEALPASLALDPDLSGGSEKARRCPRCKKGHLIRVAEIPPSLLSVIEAYDSS